MPRPASPETSPPVRWTRPSGWASAAGTVEFTPGSGAAAAESALDAPCDVVLFVGSFEDDLAAAPILATAPASAVALVGAGVDEVLAPLGGLRDGFLGPAQWVPEVAPEPDEGPTAAWFVRAYYSATGEKPSYPAAQAFAAGVVAARCRRDAGGTGDGDMLAAARALRCRTLLGEFRLDTETGLQVGHRVLTVQWQEERRRSRVAARGRRTPPRVPASTVALMTLTRREISQLLERHGLAPSRALGQNFVVDPNTVRRIARLAGVGRGRPRGRDRAPVSARSPSRWPRPAPRSPRSRSTATCCRSCARSCRPVGDVASSRATPSRSTGTTCSPAPTRVDARRQPAVQRRHAAGARPARRRARRSTGCW